MAGRIGLRGVALATTVLCSGLASPAMAQTSDFAQRFVNADEFGVDVSTGKYVYDQSEGSISSGAGTLSVDRVWSGSGWQSNLAGQLNRTTLSSGQRKVTLNFGTRSVAFLKTGSTFVPENGDGGLLIEAPTGTDYSYTTSDGTVYIYNNPSPGTDIDDTAPKFCENATEPTCFLLPSTRQSKSGELTTLEWTTAVQTIVIPYGGGNLYRQHSRLKRIYDNAGAEVVFNYASGATVGAVAWYQRSSVDFRRATDSGPSSSITYSYPDSVTTTVTDGAGGVWKYKRDSSGRLSSIQKPTETTPGTVITYDSASGLITKVVKNGVTRNYTWSTSPSFLSLNTTGDQQATVTSQTSTSQPIARTTSNGASVQNVYDPMGRLTQTTFPEGNKVSYVYDAKGNVTQATVSAKPGSSSPDIVTNAAFLSCFNGICNRPSWTKDAAGNQTDYTYDSVHGQLTKVELPAPAGTGARPTTIIGYAPLFGQYRNSEGALVTSTTPQYKPNLIRRCAIAAECSGTANEVRITITYNASLLPATMTYSAGDGSVSATSTYAYTTANKLASVDGPLPGTGDTVYFIYDAKGRVLGKVYPDPDGSGPLVRRMERFGYRTDGQIESFIVGTTATIDQSTYSTFQTKVLSFDINGRKTHERSYAGTASSGALTAIAQYSYDSAGRLECAAVRMNSSVFGTLPASACTHSTSGSAVSDRISRMVYDADGRPISVTNGYGTSASATERLVYTANGKIAWVQDGMNNRTAYTYDAYDRVVKVQFPVTTVGAQSVNSADYETYDYDNRGLLVSVRDRAGGIHALVYDNLSRLTSKVSPNGEPARTVGYDLFDRPTNIGHAGDVVSHSFTYDALGRLKSASNALGTLNFETDVAGRRTRLTWPDNFYVGYEYDVAGNMKVIRENGATSGVGILATFVYDSLGRRVSLAYGNGMIQNYTFDGISRLATLGHDLTGTGNDVTTTFGYNAANQITSSARTTSAYAWTPTIRDWNYTTNGLNQYTQADSVGLSYTDSRGNLTSSGSYTYSYSSENLMTSGPNGATMRYDPLRRLREIISGPTPTTRRFLYDDNDMIAEYGAEGTILNRYVHGPAVDELLVSYEGSGVTDRRFLLSDERGSITTIADSSGAIVATNTYDEFGTPSATNMGRFQYTGQTWLPEIGLYYYKARMYSPSLGRFLQSDPIGYADGMNWYTYVGADPINSRDPTGLAEGEDPGEVVVTGNPCSITSSYLSYRCIPNQNQIAQILSNVGAANGYSGGGGGGAAQTDRCAAFATGTSTRRQFSVGGGAMKGQARPFWDQLKDKFATHGDPFSGSFMNKSYWASHIDIYDVAGFVAMAAARGAIPSGINLRSTFGVGGTVGYDARSMFGNTSYVTVIFGPINGRDPLSGLPTRPLVSVFPGC